MTHILTHYSALRAFQIAGLVCLALFTAQCSDSEGTVTESEEEIPAPVFHPQLMAKPGSWQKNMEGRVTTSADGMMRWEASDTLKVFIATGRATSWSDQTYRYVTNAQDCVNNLFTADKKKTPSLQGEEYYDWYVMSPYCDSVTAPTGTSAVFSLDGQTQDGHSSIAHLADYDVMTDVVHRLPGNQTPQMKLEHKTTRMSLELVNATKKTLTVKQVGLVADQEVSIGGTYLIDFNKGGAMVPQQPRNTQTLQLKQPYELMPGKSLEVHIVLPPFTLSEGKTLTVQLQTLDGMEEQSIQAEKDETFAAGTWNKAIITFQEKVPEKAVFAKGVTKTSGWYDVNKKGDGRTENGDAVMCWAAASANMLQWWQDRYLEANGSLPEGVVTGKGKKYELALFELFQQDWINDHGSEVYYGIPWYFTGENRGEFAAYTAQPKAGTGGAWKDKWPELETLMGTDYVPYLQYYYGWGPERSDLSKQPLEIVTDWVVQGIKEGMVSLSITAGFSNQHAITLWGYELDEQGKLCKMYITDSDDLISKPKEPRVQLLNEYSVSQEGDEVMIRNEKNQSYPLTQITRFKGYSK